MISFATRQTRAPSADATPGKHRAAPALALALALTTSTSTLPASPAPDPTPTNFPAFTLESSRPYILDLARSAPSLLGTNAEAFFLQARFHKILGDIAPAETAARTAFALDTNRADILVFLSQILVRADRMDEAVSLLRQALQVSTHVETGQLRLGMALERMGDTTNAHLAFLQAASQYPNDPVAQHLLGKSFLEQGNLSNAITHLKLACQLDPTSANPFYTLFQALSKTADSASAREALDTFKRLKTVEKQGMGNFEDDGYYNNEEAMRNLASVIHTDLAALLITQGRKAEAEHQLLRATQIAPDLVKPRELLAQLCLRNGRLLQARHYLEYLASTHTNRVAYAVDLGTLLLQLNDFAPAVAQLRRALILNPDQPQALHNLARYYLASQQNLPEALSLAKHLVEVEPRAAHYSLLARAWFANGRTNESLQAMTLAVQQEPDSPVYREQLRRTRELLQLPN